MTPSKKKAMVRKKENSKLMKIEKEPDYMVQVNEPKMVRKDILESLREVIIFMQGYEKFRKIQEEKVTLFSSLKSQVRELNSLTDGHLRKYLPKGKLRPQHLAVQEEGKEGISLGGLEVLSAEKMKPVRPVKQEFRLTTNEEEEEQPKSELDELEAQLKDIEEQLKNIK